MLPRSTQQQALACGPRQPQSGATPPRPVDSLPRTMGERIAAVRQARGYNRNQLARILGTTWPVVNRWEKDRTRPSVESLQRLASAFDVSVDCLAGSAPIPQGADVAEFSAFLRWHAPKDLSDEEQRWLASAPAGSGRLTAEDLAELLRLVRHRALGR